VVGNSTHEDGADKGRFVVTGNVKETDRSAVTLARDGVQAGGGFLEEEALEERK
jgi:hypothetical protein